VQWLNDSEATPETDAIVLRYADPASSISIRRHINPTSATIDASHNFENGDHLVIVDSSCRHIGMFENTSSSNSQLTHSTGGGSGGNCTHVLRNDDVANDLVCVPGCNPTSCDGRSPVAYADGSNVMSFVANGYYIADSTVLPGTPALKRRVLTSSGSRSEELAQGVEDMQLLFGYSDFTDTNPETVVNFLTATDIDSLTPQAVAAGLNSAWDKVISIKIQLVLRSQTEVLDENETIRNLNDFNSVLSGVDIAEPDCEVDVDECDRFLRQIITSTVRIRNRS
jgi:type IV pilus assembly protein PilW